MTASRIPRLISTRMSISRLMGDLNFYREPRNSQVDDAKVRSVESRLSRWRSASSACCIVVRKPAFYRSARIVTESSVLNRTVCFQTANYTTANIIQRLGSVLLRLAIATHFSLSRAKACASEWKWNFDESAHFCPFYNYWSRGVSEIFSTINDDDPMQTIHNLPANIN